MQSLKYVGLALVAFTLGLITSHLIPHREGSQEIVKAEASTNRIIERVTTIEGPKEAPKTRIVEKIIEEKKSEILLRPKTRYRLGLHVEVNRVMPPTLDEIRASLEVKVGVRMGDLPLWLEGGYKPSDKSLTLGLSYEF